MYAYTVALNEMLFVNKTLDRILLVYSKTKRYSYNRRKLDELPFHYYQLHQNDFANSPYLTDLNWIYDKVCGSNCFQILEDIRLLVSSNKFVDVLRSFLETNASVLNYDGRQFYAQLRFHLEKKIRDKEINVNDSSAISNMYNATKKPPVLSIIPLECSYSTENQTSSTLFKEKCIDLITRLDDSDQFVVSISTEKEEISVWDIKK